MSFDKGPEVFSPVPVLKDYGCNGGWAVTLLGLLNIVPGIVIAEIGSVKGGVVLHPDIGVLEEYVSLLIQPWSTSWSSLGCKYQMPPPCVLYNFLIFRRGHG